MALAGCCYFIPDMGYQLYSDEKRAAVFSAYQLASLRILISSVCLLPVALRNLSKFNKKNFFSILIIGFVGSAFANVIYYFLIRDTSPVVASVVEYFIPIVATLWGLSDN